LPEKVLSREKDTTWRIGDDKNLQVDDEISLCHTDGSEFGKAKILWTKETKFANLTEEDREGHEKFSSEEEMYQKYSGYYNIKVGPETPVKVIKFNLL
ncbi:MAG: ASCH domain-containing protein, partial [Candidatus Pacearchaeota archaeon]